MVKALTNRKIAAVLEQVVEAMEIQGANPFRIRAHRRAIETIEKHARPLAELYAEGGEKALQELPGIGAGLASKIGELLDTGGLGELRRLDRETPPELRELLHLPGVGPKSVQALNEALGVASLEDLRAACEAGRVRELEGFGEKSERKILEALEAWQGREVRYLLSVAGEMTASLKAALEEVEGVRQVEAAGSLRRCRETVGDLDLLVSGGSPEDVMGAFREHPAVEEVVLSGETKTTVRLDNGMQADLRLVDPDCYGAALVYFTGSKQHNVLLRTRAKARGLKISEYGVFKGAERLAGATEEEVYATLDLPWIPPELREDRGEIEAAAEGRLPRLLERADIKGDLQMHTVGSDGTATPEEMAEAARRLGYEYIAVTDHSQAVTVAGGMNDEEMLAWCRRLEEADARVEGIRILKGVEVDILKDGSLDLEPDTLRAMDWVVATVHSHFGLDREIQTERIVRAVASGLVHCWGHPTARRIGSRDPIDVDLEAVFRACREHGVAVEIDGAPERLDLNDRNAMAARDQGLKLVLSTDAHGPGSLDWMRFAVGVARRAWLRPEDVLNTLPLDEFLAATARPAGSS